MTLDRYGHLFPKLDEELTDRLDALHREAATAPASPRPPGGHNVRTLAR